MLRAATLACALAFAILFPGILRPANAQTSSASISVEVRDAHTRASVHGARVVLSGPLHAIRLSDQRGDVRFADLPPGTYSVAVSAPRHLPGTIERIVVEVGDSVVSVDLAPDGLPSIGSVRVRPGRARRDLVNESSPARRLSEDPLDALGRLPGVQTTSATDENGLAGQDISIEGHPAGQTGISIDGLPLIAPGLARDVTQYAADVFAGGRVAYEPQPGAPGGTIDFSTLNPTLQWRGTYSGTTGARDLGIASYTVSGSFHGLGIVAVRSIRGAESALSGHTYADTSGLDYRRAGSTLRDASFEKLQKAFGNGAFATVTILDAERHSDLNCVEWYNAEPCGLGPGNEYRGTFRFRSLQFDTEAGRATFRGAAYFAQTDTDLDLLHRFVAGAPAPLGEFGSRLTSGTTLQGTVGLGSHQISAVGAVSRIRESDTALFGPVRVLGKSTQRFDLFQVSDSWTSSQRVRIVPTAGTLNTDAGSGPFASLSAQYKAGGSDNFSAFAATGRQVSPLTPAIPFVADPAALRFSCGARLAFGPGGSDAPTAGSATSLRASWDHEVGKSGNVLLTGYEQMQRGTSLRLPVSSVALASGTLGSSYFSTADAEFSDPANCGTPIQLQPSDLYLGQLISGVGVLYRGVRVSADLDLSRQISVQAFAALQDARLDTADSRLAVPQSYYHSGDALPGVARMTYGITADYKPAGGFVEWLAAVRGLGANNSSGRGPLAFVDLAAYVRFVHGSLTARVSNAFSTGSSDFAFPTGVPRFTDEGRLIPQLAYPIAPRAISLTYTMPFGRSYDRPPGSTRDLVGTRDTAAARAFTPLPASPPHDSFEIRNGSPACSLVRAQRVARLLGELQTFTRKLGAAPGHFPERPSGTITSTAGYDVRYRSLGSTYVITIVIRNVNVLSDWVGCARLHRATEAEAMQRGLFGSAVSFEGFAFYYMPAVGFYAISSAEPLTPPRRYDVDVPNPHPFDIETYQSCTPGLRPIAASLLAELRTTITAGEEHFSDHFRVHRKGTTLVIDIVDPVERGAVLNCARISSGDAAALQRRGLEGEPEPSFNYDRRYGLFVIPDTKATEPGR